jgi:uncharacterized iron-regulated membrane protein
MSQDRKAPAVGPFYHAVWRWHFYAGLFVLPFLLLLALTGGLYLFKGEIDGLLYRDLATVQPQAEEASPDQWLAAAGEGVGGAPVSVLVPARPDRAVRIDVQRPEGDIRTAFIDPYDATMLGDTPQGGVLEFVKRMHSLTLVGPWANLLVEVVAGWTIVLVATGLFLWLPRRRRAAALRFRSGDPARRPFWRDLHAVTGFYAGAVILFLAVTGMPWSAFWGDRVMGAVRESGLGRPAAPPAAESWTHVRHARSPQGVGWTMEGVTLHVHPDHHQQPGSLASVMKAVDASGMARPYIVSIPSSPDLAWAVAYQGQGAENARTLYIGGDGAVAGDVRYPDFGAGAKAFEWSIAVHQGTQYGWANRIVMLLGCIAVWVLAISGAAMWWKRRARSPLWRRLGAPPAPPGLHARAAVLGIVLPLAVLYPLTGLTLAVVMAFDRIIMRLRRVRAPRPA